MVGRLRIAAVLAATLMLSSCAYWVGAVRGEQAGGAVPWWCTSTEEIPVTEGPAVGNVDYYAGTHKAPLSWADCKKQSAQFDQAKAFVEQWPTAASAVADGWKMATTYIPGMGTHHFRGGITPALLTAPSFNRFNPNLDAAGLDNKLDFAKPEVLQFDGNGPTAKLVGFDYYVKTSTGQPPAGFPGNNDWWHIHPWICFRTTDAAMVGFNISEASCTSQQGINVYMANFYMLHVWVLDDMKFEPDVFAGMMPCITNGSAIHDADHVCHTSREGATAAHDMNAMHG